MDHWPCKLFPAVEVNWRLVRRTTQPGVNVDAGVRPGYLNGGGYWTCEMSGIWLRKQDQIMLARALDTLMDGGAAPIVITSCEGARVPWTRDLDPVHHSDQAPFSDGALYSGRKRCGTSEHYAPLRATSMQILLPDGVALKGGEVFSILHPRMGLRRYQIGRVHGSTVTFRPELREAVMPGTPIQFDPVGSVMQLANGHESMSAIRLGRFADLAPVFVEVPYAP
ncbi:MULTISPECIES: hypothetical protein [unclassified Brevundimonas]|uniref:hypothetical protein n=1 Tax=unclassified Brevundimonas TaxID=2622653 RepID=UPI0025BAE123|nr:MULTISPECIES: hypothetical protein [unclassified Brevundimonas]